MTKRAKRENAGMSAGRTRRHEVPAETDPTVPKYETAEARDARLKAHITLPTVKGWWPVPAHDIVRRFP